MWILHSRIIHFLIHQRFVLLHFQQSQRKPSIAPAPRTIRPSRGSRSKTSPPSRTTSCTNGLGYRSKHPVHSFYSSLSPATSSGPDHCQLTFATHYNFANPTLASSLNPPDSFHPPTR